MADFTTRASDKINHGVAAPKPHDSAHKHVSGYAEYIDDMPTPSGLLHGYLGLTQIAHGTIESMNLDDVRASEGVVAVFTADDLSHNDISPTGLDDEPILSNGEILFHGQPAFFVIAETRDQARRAAQKAKISYKERPHQTDVVSAMEANYPHVTAPLTLQNGDAASALDQATNRLSGEMLIGGQDHFYLEGHIAMAIPGEDDDVIVWSSTQHPSEVQHMVSHALQVPSHAVTVNVRRMGGGFGGKETQSNQFAVLAAIAAKRLGRAIKVRPDRDDDMIITGKRHDFHVAYDVGYDDDGVIEAVDATFAARCGFSADLSGPVTDRALFHADNCYYLPNVRLQSRPMMTNTVSNTAYRGFGGPQGMMGCERIIEDIAYALGKDPLDIRKANFYGDTDSGRNMTPYHQMVSDNIIAQIVGQIEEEANYQARRKDILAFNEKSPIIKKGIALTPVKFGISFTATWYNQAGALVHIYQDGSIQLNHGGTEMGQGLYTKVAQVLADEFQVDLDLIKITATSTGKVPNTSATAASSGTDLNGMAAANAAQQIKARLVDFAIKTHDVSADDVQFVPNHIKIKDRLVPFADFIKQAYMGRVQLSATGFYKTPKIHWDRETGQGHPFYYYAYGASISEVSIDTLTGEYMVDRADILHDVGNSLNPAIDIGQVQGGFIQGMGWLTTEELWWDEKGRLRTHAPSTYKIPLASDRPKVFNVGLADWSTNFEPTIRRSKAVGEPPFMLAMSVFEAISMAVASVADYKIAPRLDAPATPERVLMAIQRLERQKSGLNDKEQV